MLAGERRLLVGPQPLHGQHPLPDDRPALAFVDAVVLHLLLVPAEADAEREPAARQQVERGDLLGRDDRVPLGEEEDAGADPQPSVVAAAAAVERDERVERALVLVGQVARRPGTG